MDDYLTKPIRTEGTDGGARKSRRTKVARETSVGACDARTLAKALDMAAALDRLGGDRDLYVELVEVFKGEFPNVEAAMRRAIDERDAGALSAVRIRSAGRPANLAPSAVSEAAMELEKLARSGKWKAPKSNSRPCKRKSDSCFPSSKSSARGVTGLLDGPKRPEDRARLPIRR